LKIIFLILFQIALFADVIDVNRAFKADVVFNQNAINIEINISKGSYLYEDKLKFSIASNKDFAFENYSLPKASLSDSGKKLYFDKFSLTIPINKIDKNAKEFIFTLKYQGCSSDGLCYRPVKKKYNFTYESNFENKNIESIPLNSNISLEESIVNKLKSQNFIIVLISFFGFGLLLSLTPCIFPMIPILSSIILSQRENLTVKKGFFLSLIYVLAMSFAYLLIGIIASLFGSNIQIAMQNPWLLTLFSLIFIALALSLFGFYELKIPTSWLKKLSDKSEKASQRGDILGIAIMGFLSTLIVGPCIAPPLAGAILYIGQTGDILLGGASLFTMGLGMGVPLLIIGAGAKKIIPKPSSLMEVVSKVFGVVMLVLAIWILSRFLPTIITMSLWASLFVISAVYLGALEPLKDRVSFSAFFKGVALIIMVYGFFILFGAFTGATNPLNPLEKLQTLTLKTDDKKLSFKNIKKLEKLQKEIRNSDSFIMVDFRANWCVSCKELEEITFKDKRVIEALSSFKIYKVDVSENSKEQKDILKHFDVVGLPAILFFKNQKEIKNHRVYGYKSPKEFLDIAKQL